MQWVAKNAFSFNKKKGRNKSTEPAQPSAVFEEDDENSKLQQQFSHLSATEAEQQMQDDATECAGHSIEETLVRIPGRAVVNLVEAGEEVSDSPQLGSGEFSIVRLVQGNTGIALFVNVGEDVRWPLTKDEPTLKLDARHYLFSIRPPPDEEAADKDGTEILNYGVTFADEEGLDLLDSFLQQHACLSLPAESTGGAASKSSRSAKGGSKENPEAAYWTALAPRVEDYNSVVAKAIAAGSGQIIKGLFLCTNAYSSQVQNGGESVRSRATKAESKTAATADYQKKTSAQVKISPRTKRNIRRAKRLSRMTEKLSENVLAGVVTVSGGITAPVLGSKAGQKFFRMLPGDVLLASLDAFNKVLDAAEIVGKDALSAASEATVEIVANRFGEEAGEVTHDTFAVAGHCIGTAWNVTKVRKTINPVSNGTLSASALKALKLKKASKAVTSASKSK